MRKLLTILVVAFLLWYLVTQPANAADAVKGAGTGIQSAFSAVVDFLDALFA